MILHCHELEDNTLLKIASNSFRWALGVSGSDDSAWILHYVIGIQNPKLDAFRALVSLT